MESLRKMVATAQSEVGSDESSPQPIRKPDRPRWEPAPFLVSFTHFRTTPYHTGLFKSHYPYLLRILHLLRKRHIPFRLRPFLSLFFLFFIVSDLPFPASKPKNKTPHSVFPRMNPFFTEKAFLRIPGKWGFGL